jgi:hypothetical protein
VIQFPLNEKAMFVVIEPGNLKRMKDGNPLIVKLPNDSEVLIAFTPDAEAFLSHLGLPTSMPPRGTVKAVTGINLSASQIAEAMRYCQNFPEVER